MDATSIHEMFIIQDCGKDLLFNACSERQEKEARRFLSKIEEKLEKLYIIPANVNV